MAEVKGNPIQRGALRIGSGLLRSAKLFRRGITSGYSLGRDTVQRTSAKIKSTQKKIDLENKNQRRIEQKAQELVKRQAKEKNIELKRIYGAVNPIKSVVSNAIKRPLDALLKLFAAWAVQNIPLIIKEIEKFVKKVRIAAASINYMIRSVGGVFSSLVKIAGAIIENAKEFDFNDESKRVESARRELDENIEEIGVGFESLKNVWNKDEAELDKLLEQLEKPETVRDAIRSVAGDMGGVDPQTPAVGEGGVKADTYGMSVDAVTNTKWKPLLNLIASVESVDGSYDSAYPNMVKNGLSQMTIAEAAEWQSKTTAQRGSAAAGRYQFMDIQEQAAAVGLKPTDKFSPENQDRMAIGLITNKRGVSFDMLKNDPQKAQLELSKEWAGLPMDASDKSFYADDGKNSAGTTTEEIEKAFAAITAPLEAKAETKPQESATTQRPQAPTSGVGKAADSSGMTIGSNVLYAKDFDTMDYNAPSPIIRTSNRGMRNGRMHQGIDFGTGGQTGWYCGLLLDGVVSYVGYDGRGGNMVFIKSGGLEYVFMHLAKYSPGIRQGAKYAAGQPIGEVGNTGQSAGIHLHFEVRRNNKPGEAASHVRYVVFGKLKKTSKSSASNIAGDPQAKAQEVASAASSMRTNTSGETSTSVVVIRQTERIIT